MRAVLVLGSAVSVPIFLAFGVVEELWAWHLLRFAFAFGVALLFTVSEYIVVSRSGNGRRGELIGWYAAAVAAGTAMGPMVVVAVGLHGMKPFLVGAALFLAVVVPVIFGARADGRRAPASPHCDRSLLAALPVAFAAAMVFGIADSGGIGLLPVFGVQKGYSYEDAAALASFAALGAILLQVPIARATERVEPVALLAGLSLGLVFLLLALCHLTDSKPVTFMLALLSGGLVEGLYTIGLVYLGRRFAGPGLAAANACFVSMCGIGEVAGPLAVGAGMDGLGPQGYGLILASVLGLFAWFASRSFAPAR